MMMGGSLENHYECYLKMAARRPAAILILGADCCDTVSGSGFPSRPGGTFLRSLNFAVVEDTEICFVGWLWGDGGCGFPVSAYKRNLEKRESCLWRKTSTAPKVLNLT
jgi:hypothetical protein